MAWCGISSGGCFIFFRIWWLLALQNRGIQVRTIGYSFFAAVFNVGWAATQVSHMSMVNCITLNSTSRVVLASCRNAFTMYRWIAFSSIFIGCCFVALFHIGTEEPRLKREADGKSVRISWTYWFNKLLYYQVAIVYVLTRLVTNVSQAFLAFYVTNDLKMAQSSKALVPAVIYICSFIVSVLLQEISWTGQRLKVFYSAGGLLWVLGVSLQSFLIGEDLNGCAFVYGSLSFMDKILCGVALSLLESYQSSVPEVRNHHHANLSFSITRYGLGLVPAIYALAGVLVTLTMKLPDPRLKPLMALLLA